MLNARPTSRTIVIAAAVTLLSSPVPAGAQPQCSARTFTACGVRIENSRVSFPSDSAVLGPLGPLIDAMPGAGIVIGLLEPDGRTRVITHGMSGRHGVPLSDSTVFEIGSVTKVFTAVVLADMVAKHEVQLDDPVANYLPPSVRMPSRDGRAITLLDLATHTSGLPRNPANLAAADSGGPYARYDVDDLYAFLSSYGLTRVPATQFEYSNVGFGLLGHALARHADTSYDALVRARLLDPLGMRDTRIELDAEREARFAVGHAVDGTVVGPWELPALAGAGAYRSTVADLLRFVKANLASSDEPLRLTLASTRVARRATPVSGMGTALGWQTYLPDNDTVPAFVWKDGQTGGFASFIGVDVARHRGVVMLANVAGAEALDAVGIGLLSNKNAGNLASGASVPTDSVLDTYVGEYELAPTFHMVVTRAKHTLYVQATGQNRLTLLPRSDREFDVVGVAARVRFDIDAGGHVASLVLEQGGKASAARRIQ